MVTSQLRVLVVLVGVTAVAAPQVRRTVYVAAVAADGGTPADLRASDLSIKEGGETRQIVRVEPMRGKLQVAIAVEELLTPDNDVRRSVANFIDLIRDTGQLALYVVGQRSQKRVDYTSQVLPFATAINKFPVRAVEQGNMVEAIHEIARDQRAREGRRAIVAVAVDSAQVSQVPADAVFEQLRAGNGVLYAATLAGWQTSTAPSGTTSGGRRLDLEAQVSGLERDKVFSSGTRQSGGLHLASQRTAGMWKALERIADELNHQYVVTYDSDARSDGSVTIESTRRGLTVRGPTRAR